MEQNHLVLCNALGCLLGLMPNVFNVAVLHYSLFCLKTICIVLNLLASEPNLKVKLKKHLNTRKSPLTRKESAPPTVKHRVPDTLGKRKLNLDL